MFKSMDVPSVAARNSEINLHFEPLPLEQGDYIEVSAIETDSSFTITYSGGDSGRCISIPAKEFQRQKNGQLKLEATTYRDIPLQQFTGEGGALQIIYGLRPVTINFSRANLLYTAN